MKKRIIFHIDVNNAFLSWTAVKKLKEGEKIDIRKIPSIIGGDEKQRHGIVLAKSPIAKKYNIVTAETIYSARKKCPNLKIYEPDFRWYYKESNLFYNYLKQYTPNIERYSVDECFLDLTGTNLIYNDYLSLAYKIKDDIKNKFGFTVNVGIGNNRLCAKMASDFEKPDKVHTLYEEEIKSKMWPLPIDDLFMVGKKTAEKLKTLGIYKIGDLALADKNNLNKYFKNQTTFLINSAKGIDESAVEERKEKNDSISVSETLAYDYTDKDKIKEVLFRQTDEVTRLLRKQKRYAKTVAITYKNNLFLSYQKQTKLEQPSNTLKDIYKTVLYLLDISWKDEAIRNIGIRLTDFVGERQEQISIYNQIEEKEEDKIKDTDKMQDIVDEINEKYGNNSIIPASIKIIVEREK